MSEEPSCPKKIRHRLPISCYQCRRRKRRCDRNQPCHTCVSRGEGESCSYETPGDGHQGIHLDDVRYDNQLLKERVHRLEGLVKHLAGQNPNSTCIDSRTGSSDLENTLKDTRENSYDTEQSSLLAMSSAILQTTAAEIGPGHLAGQGTGNSDKSRYKSATSWDSILTELEDLKLAVDDVFDPLEAGPRPSLYNTFPFSNNGEVSIQNLYTALPDRREMDSLLLQYLNSYHPFYPIIHPDTFKKEYQCFLSNPRDPTFAGLLFSMMALAIVNGEPKSVRANCFAALALQALQLSDFITNFNLTTVVVMINVVWFYGREQRQYTFAWVMFGLALQQARALGLHRDPLHFGIGGLACQTRRHIWSALVTQDAVHAARYGRTTIIDEDEWDTKRPDEITSDLSPGELPAPTSYTYMKRIISKSVSNMCRALYKARARPPYSAILAMEESIREDHAAVPTYMSDNTAVSSIHWLYCCFSPILLNYQLLVLHRSFMIRKTPEFTQSRVQCLRSARELIRIVKSMRDREGLDNYKWHTRELCNIASVPAASILCVGLYILNNPAFPTLSPDQVGSPQLDREMIESVIDAMETGSSSHRVISQLYDKVNGSPTVKQEEPVPFNVSHPDRTSGHDTKGNSGTPEWGNLFTSLGVGVHVDWNTFIAPNTQYNEPQIPYSQFGRGINHNSHPEMLQGSLGMVGSEFHRTIEPVATDVFDQSFVGLDNEAHGFYAGHNPDYGVAYNPGLSELQTPNRVENGNGFGQWMTNNV